LIWCVAFLRMRLPRPQGALIFLKNL